MSEATETPVKKPTNIDKLTTLLGFDPIGAGDTSTALKEAMTQIKEEQVKKNTEESKKLLIEAIKVRGEMDGAEKAFNKQKHAFDKTLGKLLGRLEAMAGGKPAPEEAEAA